MKSTAIFGMENLALCIMWLFFADAAEIWHLENLVHYIRLTTAKMQDISIETFVLRHEEIDWDFPEDLLDLVQKENQKWA